MALVTTQTADVWISTQCPEMSVDGHLFFILISQLLRSYLYVLSYLYFVHVSMLVLACMFSLTYTLCMCVC